MRRRIKHYSKQSTFTIRTEDEHDKGFSGRRSGRFTISDFKILSQVHQLTFDDDTYAFVLHTTNKMCVHVEVHT